MATAFQPYQVTAAGDGRIIVNGIKAHAGRLVVVDTNSTAAAALLKEGYIAAVTTATVLDDGVAPLQTYTVQASGNGKILHNGAIKLTGNTLALDPLEPSAMAMVARGIIA